MIVDNLSTFHRCKAERGYWNWNLFTGEANWSPECYRIFGYTVGECRPGREALLARLHPDDRETVTRAWGDAIDNNMPYKIDFRVIWPDGTTHEVCSGLDSPLKDAAEKPVMMFGTVREITGYKKGGAKLRWKKKQPEILSGAEEKLWDEVQYQANLIAHISDAIISTDPNGIIKSWNRAAERVYGWTAAEAIGKHAVHLLKIRFVGRSPEETFGQLVEQGRTEVEVILENKDGRILNVISTISVLKDSKGEFTGTVGIMRDITECKLTEKALRESEEKMRVVFEQAALGINQVGLDGRYINANQKFCDMCGYTKDELMKLTIRDMYHSSNYRREEERMQRLLSGEISIYTEEMKCLCKNGDQLWVNITASLVRNDSKPAYFIGIVEDISYRKQMEEALQDKQDELASANEELLAQQEELTAVNEELQNQQEELIAINGELQSQTAKLNTAYQELQHQAAEIREYGEIAAQARDRAERRAAELDAAISSIAAGVVIYNHLGNILRMNEIAQNVFEYSEYDCNTAYRERYTRINLCKADGSYFEAEELPLYRALNGETICDEEIMITRCPGTPVWLSETLTPIFDPIRTLIGVILIFTDITTRKRKVEDLLASERELLKVTLNSLGEGVVTVDSDDRVILINESAANLTGYSQAEATGQPLNKIIYVCDDKTSEPIVVNASQKIPGNPILVTRDLREIPVAINSSPIKTVDGRIIGTVIVLQDISEKQKTERELLKADKLESLGILAGGIAHDFNNILAAILLNIQLAVRKMERNEDIRKYLLNTVETTRKASDLTKQLLTFSKGGAPVKKDASLIELIKDTTEFVLRGANIKAEFAIPDDLWAVCFDESQISQVIYNLVINAKQAMPRGGIIHISAENVIIGGDSRFAPGNYIKITLADQGDGISKENLSKIFDPFFTTKKDGSGLGLATSYSIISRHNGYLEAESREGDGTAFFIYLPASCAPVVRNKSEKEIAVSRMGLKILFMDDEVKILDAVGEMLVYSFGYQVALVTDGAKAIQLYKDAKESGEPFDAVIMDLTVPGGMGGQEAIAYLRNFDPEVKAIVSSGYANDPIIADFKRYGFCGMVSKPYKIDELNEVLHMAINPAF